MEKNSQSSLFKEIELIKDKLDIIMFLIAPRQLSIEEELKSLGIDYDTEIDKIRKENA